MNSLIRRRAAVLVGGFLIGIASLVQVAHEESSAMGFCRVVCRCVRCGWAAYPTRLCIDWTTRCAGPGLVHNCSSYCGAK